MSRTIIKWWSIVAILLFIIAMMVGLFNSDNVNHLITFPTADSLITAMKNGLRIIIIYLILSFIPVSWPTKTVCFISTAIVFSGIGSIIAGFSFNHTVNALVSIIFNINYLILVYTIATISIQTINNVKYQSNHHYILKWFNSLKHSLGSTWCPLIVTMVIYFILMAITPIPVTPF
ncbi:hypothetical protein MOO44_02000 [Nicoliella spurrieriana]|uniref:Uncharacterized protein n=1 Tax=Nicoliella spurrieriana TaxID=2925830 RepID=A0A976X5W0_9LACO|nr:hypothetical protein MOO44_02000 [Nicoliella spurrieriana]